MRLNCLHLSSRPPASATEAGERGSKGRAGTVPFLEINIFLEICLHTGIALPLVGLRLP
jgi:hypothetical protein